MDYVNFVPSRSHLILHPIGLNPCRYSSAVVEQLTCNQQVPSSTLGGGTTFSFSLLSRRFPDRSGDSQKPIEGSPSPGST